MMEKLKLLAGCVNSTIVWPVIFGAVQMKFGNEVVEQKPQLCDVCTEVKGLSE